MIPRKVINIDKNGTIGYIKSRRKLDADYHRDQRFRNEARKKTKGVDRNGWWTQQWAQRRMTQRLEI